MAACRLVSNRLNVPSPDIAIRCLYKPLVRSSGHHVLLAEQLGHPDEGEPLVARADDLVRRLGHHGEDRAQDQDPGPGPDREPDRRQAVPVARAGPAQEAARAHPGGQHGEREHAGPALIVDLQLQEVAYQSALAATARVIPASRAV